MSNEGIKTKYILEEHGVKVPLSHFDICQITYTFKGRPRILLTALYAFRLSNLIWHVCRNPRPLHPDPGFVMHFLVRFYTAAHNKHVKHTILQYCLQLL